MKEKIGKVVLNYDNYSGTDLYSDGDIEDELLAIVSNHEESEFEKIIKEQNKWPILYHLSSIRSNIIEALDIKKEANVLEIGSGCGAITGTLSDKAKEVTCIELSKKRSLINAYRNKHRDNIEIIIGNFEDIEKTIENKYDFITLIGVFEYAESYILSDKPYEKFLNIVRKHLKDDGKLIIAIENKFGLKYWAGTPEDHVGRMFEGIEGYENSRGVKTFTKYELETMFKKCGFSEFEFYYPYPDYKFPNVIYSDNYLPSEEELNNNKGNLEHSRITLFNEKLVYNNIIKNKLFPLYSNSYLIVVEKDGIL